ncbi:unnamed protein product [marine sediment metagenome]|uniref:NUMOD4 domain-containing protein n=1 Tax=marine sediment metagenome TaxID=412755 RepID=X0S355_9ZZZZ
MDLIIDNQIIKSLENEEWKPLYKTYYISSKGRIASSNHRGSGRLKLMKPSLDAGGYLRTSLRVNGKSATVKMHREVGKLFIQNPGNLPVINHKNFIRDDNRVENLEWTTWKGNAIHSSSQGRLNTFKKGEIQHPNCHLKGEQVGTAKLCKSQVIEIRYKFIPRVYTRSMLAEEYGVRPCTIKDIILRKSWKHI